MKVKSTPSLRPKTWSLTKNVVLGTFLKCHRSIGMEGGHNWGGFIHYTYVSGGKDQHIYGVFL